MQLSKSLLHTCAVLVLLPVQLLALPSTILPLLALRTDQQGTTFLYFLSAAACTSTSWVSIVGQYESYGAGVRPWRGAGGTLSLRQFVHLLVDYFVKFPGCWRWLRVLLERFWLNF